MFDYTVETSKSFEEAVKSLEENLKETIWCSVAIRRKRNVGE